MVTTSADGHLDKIRKGYSFDGPAIHLGAAMIDGEIHPDAPVRLPIAMINRHGLVSGATGTGKTVTLQVMAEQLSAHGVPVFLADIKGDLTGLSTPAVGSDRLRTRTQSVGQVWSAKAFPVEYFSLGGDGRGVPVRARISDLGPLLLARVMGLNETQESSLRLVFYYADKNGLELYNLAGLRAVISYLTSDEGKDSLEALGGLSRSTAGVILRARHARSTGHGQVFRRNRVRHRGVPPAGRGRRRRHLLSEAADLAGTTRAFLHVPDVADRGPLRGTARGRGRREAQAGVLPRRSTPALPQRLGRVPRVHHDHRPAHPFQGRRHLLRHPGAQGRAVRGARPAGQPDPACPARVHPRRRQGAQGHGVHVPHQRL